MHADEVINGWSMVILHERSMESTTRWNVAAGRGFRGPFRHWAAETAESGDRRRHWSHTIHRFTMVIHKQHGTLGRKSPKSSPTLHQNQKPNGTLNACIMRCLWHRPTVRHKVAILQGSKALVQSCSWKWCTKLRCNGLLGSIPIPLE